MILRAVTALMAHRLAWSSIVASTLEMILEKLRASASDTRDKGDKFERLMVQFFKSRSSVVASGSLTCGCGWTGRTGPAVATHGIDLVAVERERGTTCAIQCKFYDPGRHLTQADIDSFSQRVRQARRSRSRLVVSTTDHWGTNAEAAIENQQIPVQRLRFMDLAESSIDWSQFDLSTPEVMELKDRKQLRPHQRAALDDGPRRASRRGPRQADHGLRHRQDLHLAAHRRRARRAWRARCCSWCRRSRCCRRSLREWSIEAEPTAAHVRGLLGRQGRQAHGQEDEDISVVDLAFPATTEPGPAARPAVAPVAGDGKLTVVFSTYQSIDGRRRGAEAGACPTSTW